MSTTSPVIFAGSIPENYDTYLGPFLFEPFAADLARRLALDPGARVLETACGSGIFTELLSRAAGPDIEIVATDIAEPMLDVARSRRGHLDNVRFEQVDATDLPYVDESFDAVVSQFGLMFVPDRPRAMRESRRVLRPGGRLAFSTWDDLLSNPYVQVAQDTIASFFERDPPTFLYQPWSLHDRDTLRALTEDAGFADVEVATVPILAQRPSVADAAQGLVTGNPTLLDVKQRATASVDEVVAAVADALGQEFGVAPFRAPMSAVVVTARR